MNIPDLLWLLLPVAAGTGYLAGRRQSGTRSDAEWNVTRRLRRELDELLAESSADDHELLDTLSASGRDAAEVHIALGNLYRRRGDIERALRLHRHIIDQTTLDQEIRDTARFELAQDFRSAGLLDRCEHELNELLESASRQHDAFDSLLQLHEQESDWQQAIAVADRHASGLGRDCASRLAHYHCELAEQALKQQDSDVAVQHLHYAIRRDARCARALMMQASLAAAAGEAVGALQLYDSVEALRPELMPEIIDEYHAALKRLGDEQRLRRFIDRIRKQRNAYTVIRSTRRVIAEHYGEALADRFFKDQILKRPSMRGLRDWAHDQLALSKPDEQSKVRVICDLLDQVIDEKPSYRCSNCGFQGNVMHWRCPGCARWDSVSTIIGVEGE